MKLFFENKKRTIAFIIAVLALSGLICAVGITVAKYVRRVEIGGNTVALANFYFHAESEDADEIPATDVIDASYNGTLGVVYITNYKDSSNVTSSAITYGFKNIQNCTLSFVGGSAITESGNYTLAGSNKTRVAVLITPTGASGTTATFDVQSTAPYVKVMSFSYKFIYDSTVPSVAITDDGNGLTTATVTTNAYSGDLLFSWTEAVTTPFASTVLLPPYTANGSRLEKVISGITANTVYQFTFVGDGATSDVKLYYYTGTWQQA